MGIIEDELARIRSATRVAPQGASSVYQPPANQVPQGVVRAGTEPMPTRANPAMVNPRTALGAASVSNDGALGARVPTQPTPPAGPSPRGLAGVNVSADGALAGRMPAAPSMPQPSVDPRTLSGVNVSNDGGLAKSLASRGGPMNTPAPTAAPVSPGPIRAAAGSISSAAGKAVGAMQNVNGQVIDGAKDLGRMTVSAARNPIVKGVGTTAGLVAGGMTGGLAANNIREGNTALGAAQGALAASSLLPGPIGAAGRMANVGYQAIVNSGVYDKGKALVQQWLNGGQPAPETAAAPAAPAAQVAPAAASPAGGAPNINPNQSWDGINAQSRATQGARDSDRLMLLNAELAKATDPQQIAWLKTEIAAAQKAGGVIQASAPVSATAPRQAPGPIRRAGASSAPPAVAAAPAIELAGPEELPTRGVIQAFGGNGSGGDTNTVQNVQTLEVPAALNAGDQSPVQVLRGNVPSQFATNADGKYVETAAVGKTLPEQLAYMQRVASTFGPEVAQIQERMARNAADNQGRLDVENVQGETSRAVAGTQAGAHIQGAQIGAAAQRYGIDAKPDVPQVKEIEEPVIGADGKPVNDRFTGLPARQKRSVQWNGTEWVPVKTAPQQRVISKADHARIAKELGDPKRVEQYLKSNNIVVQ